VPVLILLAADHVAVEAEEYSAYSDPNKPAIAVILSERQNVDQFKEHFNLNDGQVDDVLAATRRENRILAQVFGESEMVIAAYRDLPKREIAKQIAASDYDEKVAAAVARTKERIEAIVPEDRSADLKRWVDEQWNQEAQAASREDFTASDQSKGIRCKVFATQYTGYTEREVALPHRGRRSALCSNAFRVASQRRRSPTTRTSTRARTSLAGKYSTRPESTWHRTSPAAWAWRNTRMRGCTCAFPGSTGRKWPVPLFRRRTCLTGRTLVF
jgi:hypothetical protein